MHLLDPTTFIWVVPTFRHAFYFPIDTAFKHCISLCALYFSAVGAHNHRLIGNIQFFFSRFSPSPLFLQLGSTALIFLCFFFNFFFGGGDLPFILICSFLFFFSSFYCLQLDSIASHQTMR